MKKLLLSFQLKVAVALCAVMGWRGDGETWMEPSDRKDGAQACSLRRLAFGHMMLPSLRMGFSKEQLIWGNKNTEFIWTCCLPTWLPVCVHVARATLSF